MIPQFLNGGVSQIMYKARDAWCYLSFVKMVTNQHIFIAQ